MLSKKEFIKSQEDCASMLGMNLSEYETSLKNIKVKQFKDEDSNTSYDNSILSKLGLKESDLKKKRVI